jgi:hypothetical protein
MNFKGQVGMGFALVLMVLTLAGCAGSDKESGGPTSSVPGDVNADGQPALPESGASGPTSSGEEVGGTRQTEGTAEQQVEAERRAKQNRTHFKPEPPPTPLYSSPTSAARVSKPQLVSVVNQAQLDRLIKIEADGNPSGGPNVSVDFGDGRQAWALYMPESPAGSHVAITSVRSDGKTVRVIASVATPGSRCKVPVAGKSHPTSWVETRKLSGAPDLRLIPIRTAC